MAKPITESDNAADKIGKLLPAEVTGLYISMRSIFNNDISYYGYYVLSIVVISLIAGMIYIYAVRNVTNKVHLSLYAIIFVVWAFSVDSGNIQKYFGFNVPLQSIAAALSILTSFLVPAFIPNNIVTPIQASTAPPSGASVVH